MTTKLKVAVLAFILLAWPAFGQKTYQLSNLPNLNSNSLFITTIDAAGGGSRHTSFGQVTNQLRGSFLSFDQMGTNKFGLSSTQFVGAFVGNGSLLTNVPVLISNQIPQIFPLALPVFTKFGANTEPSVLRTNWPPASVLNGIPANYWMTTVSYPPSLDGISGSTWQRGAESPNILCSMDGVTWYEPAGVVNPIATSAERAEYSFVAGSGGSSGSYIYDPDIVIRQDGTMMMYYGGADNITASPKTYNIWRSSTNGWQWSAPITWLTNNNAYGEISPAAVLLNNGLIRIYYVDGAIGSPVKYVDSTDVRGTNFGSPVTCTMSDSTGTWHPDVKLAGVGGTNFWMVGQYAAGNFPYDNLWLWVSTNGVNFQTISSNICARSGAKFDYYGYYKGEILYNQDGTVDLYAGGGAPFSLISSGQDGLTSDYWRVGLFKNLTIRTNFGAVGGPITSNTIPPGTSFPLTMFWNPAKTNWNGYGQGDMWLNNLETRNIEALGNVRAKTIELLSPVPSDLRLQAGPQSGSLNADLWITWTNTSGSPQCFVRQGGDGVSGSANTYQLNTLVGPYPDAYFWFLKSVGDTSGGMQFGADSNVGDLARFRINATTFSWSQTATGNGKNITNICHITVNATGGVVGTVTAATGYQHETTYMSNGSTITSMTLALPTVGPAGQIFRLHSKSAVTTLTVTGTSFADTAVTTLTAGQTIGYQAYDGAGAYIRIE